MNPISIKPPDFWMLHIVDPSATLIDVSEPNDYQRIHASCSTQVPWPDLVEIAEQAKVCGKTIYLISSRGAIAAAMEKELESQGFDNVASIEGGTVAWLASGLPILHGHATRESVLLTLSGCAVIAAIVAAIFVPAVLMLPIFAVAACIAVVLVILADSLGFWRAKKGL